jgi:hypothetical protein
VHIHFADLVKRCVGEEPLGSKDIDWLCTLSGLDRSQLYDALANHIAQAFASNRLSFVDADATINFLWSESAFGLTGFAKDVFLAFDDGEHLTSSDSQDTDPVAKYTRPQIAGLLARKPQV